MSEVSSEAEDAGDSLDEAGDSAEDAGSDMDEAGGSASSMGSRMSTAGRAGAAALTAITTAVTGAVAGISTLVQQTSEYAKQVDRAAAQSGIGAQRIQEIAHAAEQVSGTSFDAVRDGLKELALRSEEASMGTGEAVEAFERLGISQQFLQQNDTSAIFARVRQELQGASSQMKIMASEMLLGGEAGEKMVEVLGLTNSEMQKLSQQAQSTGKVLSDQQIAALEQTRSAWRGLTSEITGLGRQLGAQFAPLVTQDVIPALRSMARSLKSAVESVMSMSDATKGVIATVTALSAAVSAALVVWGSWPSIIAAVSTAFSALTTAATTAWAAITSPITGVVAAVAAVAGAAGLIYDNWEGVSDFFSTLWTSITTSASAFGDVLFRIFNGAWLEIEKLFAQAINALIGVVNDGLTAMGAESYTIDGEVGVPSSEIEANRERLAQAQSDLSSAMSSAGSNLSGSMSGAWSAVKQSTSDAVGWLKGKMSELGSVFSLPSMPAGGGGPETASGGSSGGGGEQSSSSSEGGGGFNLLGFIQNLEPAKQKTKQLGQVGKTATSAVANGFNRINQQVGGAVSSLIRGKDAAIDFGKTLTSALGSVISKLVQVIAKLAIIEAIKGIASGGIGGATSIGGALQAAFFADGGVVTGPTLSVIGEGSEDEAVMPLSSLESMLQVPAMAQQQAQAPAVADGRGLAVQVNVEGETRTEGRDIVTSYDTSTRAQTRRGR